MARECPRGHSEAGYEETSVGIARHLAAVRNAIASPARTDYQKNLNIDRDTCIFGDDEYCQLFHIASLSLFDVPMPAPKAAALKAASD